MKKLMLLTLLFLLCIGSFYCNARGISIAQTAAEWTATPLTLLQDLRESLTARMGQAEEDTDPQTIPEDNPSTSPESVEHSTENTTEPEQTQPETTEQTETTAASPDTVRGLWVATAYAIDYPSKQTTDPESLRADCTELLDRAKADGINTIYFQVRPACDALYPSDRFPWSRYLTGTIDMAPAEDFDPLAYWTAQAHARDMELLAWVNPYRICAGSNAQRDYAALPDSSPARQHPDWVVSYNGGYYFDPGIPEVRQLIADGVQEIVAGYDVDGIQFDDYFYPGTDFDDAASYQTYGGDFSDIADWRRDNTAQLIQLIHETIHASAKNSNCRFSISPSGIWRNQSADCPQGSNTQGFEHYSQSYADTLAWIDAGSIDEICPQIYWEIGDPQADFETLAHWWAEATADSDVKLVLGLATYKIGNGKYSNTWQSHGCEEIARQLKMLHQIDGIDGAALFSACRLELTEGLEETVKEGFEDWE